MVENDDILKNKITSLSDEDLLKMVYVDKSDYREDALLIAKEEINRRKIEPINNEISNEITDENQPKKHKYNPFSLRPNNIEYGGGILIFLGIFNIILPFLGFMGTGIFHILIGLILLISGIGAKKGHSIGIYVGTTLWGLGFIGFIYNSMTNTEMSNYPGAFYLQIIFLWDLIKSTPLYNKKYNK